MSKILLILMILTVLKDTVEYVCLFWIVVVVVLRLD